MPRSGCVRDVSALQSFRRNPRESGRFQRGSCGSGRGTVVSGRYQCFRCGYLNLISPARARAYWSHNPLKKGYREALRRLRVGAGFALASASNFSTTFAILAGASCSGRDGPDGSGDGQRNRLPDKSSPAFPRRRIAGKAAADPGARHPAALAARCALKAKAAAFAPSLLADVEKWTPQAFHSCRANWLSVRSALSSDCLTTSAASVTPTECSESKTICACPSPTDRTNRTWRGLMWIGLCVANSVNSQNLGIATTRFLKQT